MRFCRIFPIELNKYEFVDYTENNRNTGKTEFRYRSTHGPTGNFTVGYRNVVDMMYTVGNTVVF